MSQIQYHSPTLTTILSVERTLKKYTKNKPISIAELKRKFPKQLNHYTVKTILEYLEQSKKIDVTINGVRWADE